MLPGVYGVDVPLHIITDRKAAIALALTLARPGDTVMLLGKGHETYQEIDGKKQHLDEREVVADWFQHKNA
jgi:UDP-N-acetylmuramoyl-L-alanyl-D-glutamate--2,6-diaminopimelate ligase